MWGLTLEGGGAKGAFQVGAYRALLENGYEFDGFTGTSIGSLNAAMLAQGDYERLYELWDNIEPENIFGPGVQSKLMEEAFSLEAIKNNTVEIKDLVLQGGIDVSPIQNYITKYVDEDKLRSTGKDFGLVTVNVTDKKIEKLFIEDIPEGCLVDYLMASSFLPVFKREQLGGKYYLDGGFADKMPYGMLVDKGYDNIVLIKIDGFGISFKTKPEEINIVEINPRSDLGNVLDFNKEHSRKLIEMGYMDAMVSLGKFFGEKYTFKGNTREAADKLFKLNDEKIRKLSEVLWLGELTGTDRLYMHVLPKLCDLLGLKQYPDSVQLAIKLVESAMEDNEFEVVQIYDIEHVIEELKSVYNCRSVEESSGGILKMNKLVGLFSKKDSIRGSCEVLFTD